ncbi:hypothetical protein KY362_01630 [Candidatus Woesearchaeota archaeon]|nr:hypothetical protein [Candidatus Woesearchaeota archaeon]
MDDVSRFQKITNIARELLDKGQAQNMQGAMRLAEKQLNAGEGAAHPAPEPIQPAETAAPEQTAPAEYPTPRPAAPRQAPDPVASPAQNPDELGQIHVKMNKIIETVNAQTSQIQKFENKINSIIADLAAMKDEIRRLKENPVTAPPLKPKQASAGQTQFKEESKPATASAEVKSSGSGVGHVRSGNYGSDDVSIEKFFYYGHK